jgi:hypothetical protein
MVALTSEALIQWNSLTGQETDRLVQALSRGWQWCWDNLWVEDKQAMRYTDRIVELAARYGCNSQPFAP